MVPPIFAINLKKDSNKKEHIQKMCDHFGYSCEFIEAIEGNKLSDEEASSLYDKKKAIEACGRDIYKPEIGCCLSHLKTHEHIVKNNIPMALVLEDDVDFKEEIREVFALTDKLPPIWDIILLGHHHSNFQPAKGSYWGQVKLNNKYKLLRPIQIAYGAYGFLVSLNGSKKLIKEYKKFYLPADHYTGMTEFNNLYILNHQVIRINKNLFEEHSNMKERKIRNKEIELQKTFKKKLIWHQINNFFFNIRFQLSIFRKKIMPLKKYV